MTMYGYADLCFVFADCVSKSEQGMQGRMLMLADPFSWLWMRVT